MTMRLIICQTVMWRTWRFGLGQCRRRLRRRSLIVLFQDLWVYADLDTQVIQSPVRWIISTSLSETNHTTTKWPVQTEHWFWIIFCPDIKSPGVSLRSLTPTFYTHYYVKVHGHHVRCPHLRDHYRHRQHSARVESLCWMNASSWHSHLNLSPAFISHRVIYWHK